MTTIELYAIVDDTGDYGVGKTPQEAAANYEENIQSISDAECTRVVKLSVAVELPKPIELTGTATLADGKATLTVN